MIKASVWITADIWDEKQYDVSADACLRTC